MASSGAGGGPSRSATVADTASGHHFLTIHGYSFTRDLLTGEKLSSRPFVVGGHRWRIDYYPNGASSAIADYVSLSLILDEDVAAAVTAKYCFRLAGEAEEKQTARLASAPVQRFASRSASVSSSPYTMLIRREDLASSKHLRNDSFTIRCDIVVLNDYDICERPIPHGRSAMPSFGAGRKPSRSAIVVDTASGHHFFRIHGYSSTKGVPTGQKISSRPFKVGGHRWRIDYYPNGKTLSETCYVSLSLILDEDVAAGVKAKYSFCLAGEAEHGQAARLASATVSTFHSRSCSGWDWSWMFIKRENLQSSNILKNDSFTVRCDILVVHGYYTKDVSAAVVSVPPCDLRGDLGKLLETEKGADVVFKIGGETVAAHRCVLAARSSVFDAELFGPMKEGNNIVVRVEDMEAEVFKALLHFAYTGSLPEMRDEEEDVTCQHLLVAADRYDMGRLKLICEEKLCGFIDVGTVATILTLAEQHHCEGLKGACFDFLTDPTNLRAAMATDGIQHLSASCPPLMAELVAMSLEH